MAAFAFYLAYPTSATTVSGEYLTSEYNFVLRDSLPTLSMTLEQDAGQFASGDVTLKCSNSLDWWQDTALAYWTRASKYPVTVFLRIYRAGTLVWEGDLSPDGFTIDAKERTVSVTFVSMVHRLAAYSAEAVRRPIPRFSDQGTADWAATGYMQDSTKSWLVDRFKYHCLIDSTGACFTITANVATMLQVSAGAPATGAYQIVPMSWRNDGTDANADITLGTTAWQTQVLHSRAQTIAQLGLEIGDRLRIVNFVPKQQWDSVAYSHGVGQVWWRPWALPKETEVEIIAIGPLSSGAVTLTSGEILCNVLPGAPVSGGGYHTFELTDWCECLTPYHRWQPPVGANGPCVRVAEVGTVNDLTIGGVLSRKSTGTIPAFVDFRFEITTAGTPDIVDLTYRVPGSASWFTIGPQPLITGYVFTISTSVPVWATGITFSFAASTGHAVGDVWIVRCYAGLVKLICSEVRKADSTFAITETFAGFSGTAPERNLIPYADFEGKNCLDVMTELANVCGCTLIADASGWALQPIDTVRAGEYPAIFTPSMLLSAEIAPVWEHCVDSVRVVGADQSAITKGNAAAAARSIELQSDFLVGRAWQQRVADRLFSIYGGSRKAVKIRIKGEVLSTLPRLWWRMTISTPTSLGEFYITGYSFPLTNDPPPYFDITGISTVVTPPAAATVGSVDLLTIPEPPVLVRANRTVAMGSYHNYLIRLRWDGDLGQLWGFAVTVWPTDVVRPTEADNGGLSASGALHRSLMTYDSADNTFRFRTANYLTSAEPTHFCDVQVVTLDGRSSRVGDVYLLP
ncbi:MAG: hypothetical protein PHU75_03880 [Candidatus Nanopelagicales bacterium]|nr:hypothetical protein [Candidatus Nanopelagicales bacterium]